MFFFSLHTYLFAQSFLFHSLLLIISDMTSTTKVDRAVLFSRECTDHWFLHLFPLKFLFRMWVFRWLSVKSNWMWSFSSLGTRIRIEIWCKDCRTPFKYNHNTYYFQKWQCRNEIIRKKVQYTPTRSDVVRTIDSKKTTS